MQGKSGSLYGQYHLHIQDRQAHCRQEIVLLRANHYDRLSTVCPIRSSKQRVISPPRCNVDPFPTGKESFVIVRALSLAADASRRVTEDPRKP